MPEKKANLEFKVGLLTQEKKSEFFELLQVCFGFKDDFKKWKYGRYPGLGPENTVVVQKDDTIVGAITLWPMQFKLGPNHALNVVVSGGASTHPRFRKRGIWWKYMIGARPVARKMGASLLIGYVTSATVTYRARLAHGISEILTQDYYVKILNYQNFLKTTLDWLFMKSRQVERTKKFSKISERLRKIRENILVIPHEGKPFMVTIKEGNIAVSELISEKPTITIEGDIRVLAFPSFPKLLKALITRKLRVKVPVKRIWNAYTTFRALQGVM